MKKYILLFSIVLLFASCKNKTTIEIEILNKYLEIPLDEDARFYPNMFQVKTVDNKDVLLFTSHLDFFINKFSIDDNVFLNKIKLIDNIKSFYFLNEDSIIVDIQGNVFIQNKNGDILESINIMKSPLLRDSINIIELDYRNAYNRPLIVYNNFIVRSKVVSPFAYLYTNNVDFSSKLSEFKYNFLYGRAGIHLIPISSDSTYYNKEINYYDKRYIDNRLGIFPNSYIDRFGSIQTALCAMYTFNNEKIIVSYPYSHSIFVYDSISADYNMYDCKSEFIEAFSSYDSDLNNAAINGEKWLKTEPSYTTIKYDKFRDLYYRIVMHRRKNMKTDKASSIQIIDNNFNLVDEIELSSSEISPSVIIPIKAGVLLLRKQDEEKKILKFDLIKVNYEK